MAEIYYKNELDYPTPEGVTDSYVDLGDGQLSNVTAVDARMRVSDYGDGGIVGLASSYATFLEALFKGALVRPASLELMTTWVWRDVSPEDPDIYYDSGIGLQRRLRSPYGDGIGHAGGGVGTTSYMYYIPAADITIIMGANVMLPSPDGIRIDDELLGRIVEIAVDQTY